jgi:prepilin-type processing-associated H-X9-DG protein/prepilin-type N-terminal cleavage/methylation domain-containing protein
MEIHMDEYQKCRQLTRAFTLVELLVVIGIIAVLISILLPTLGAARRQAQLLQCQTQIREVIHGFYLHADEHAGFMPVMAQMTLPLPVLNDPLSVAVGLGDKDRIRYSYAEGPGGVQVPMSFAGAITPYLKKGARSTPTLSGDGSGYYLQDDVDHAVLKCPSAGLDNRLYVKRGYDNAERNQGVSMVVYSSQGYVKAYGRSNSDYIFNEAVFGFDSGNAKRRLRGSLKKIQMPSQTMLMTDGYAALKGYAGCGQYPFGGLFWMPTTGSTRTVTLSSAIDGSSLLGYETSFDSIRHRRKVNIGFADGHVEVRDITVNDLKNVMVIPPGLAK